MTGFLGTGFLYFGVSEFVVLEGGVECFFRILGFICLRFIWNFCIFVRKLVFCEFLVDVGGFGVIGVALVS